MGTSSGPNIVKDSLVMYLDASNNNSLKFKDRIYNYDIWADGQTGGIGMFGQYSERNRRIVGIDPWGNDIVVWESFSVDGSINGGGIYMSSIYIDNTKMYRMSFWEKRITNSTATYCRYYFGLNGYGTVDGVLSRNTGTNTINPYFYNTSNLPTSAQLPVNEWVLFVGHVWPVGSGTGNQHIDSGRYTLSEKLGNINTDYVLRTETDRIRSRTLSVYNPNSGGVLHHSAYPRLDIIDGTEPSIDDLLNNRPDTIFDLSNNNNIGILINGLTFDDSGYLKFNGINQLIKTGYGSGLNVFIEQITISAWVKSDTTIGQRMWLDVGSDGTNQRLYASIVTSNRSDFGIQSNTWSNGVPIDTNWHYQTLVMNNGTALFYDNGIYVQSKNYTSYTLPGDIIFGGRETFLWLGNISNVKIYNRVLSADEVFKNFTMTKSRFGL